MVPSRRSTCTTSAIADHLDIIGWFLFVLTDVEPQHRWLHRFGTAATSSAKRLSIPVKSFSASPNTALEHRLVRSLQWLAAIAP